MIRKDILRKLNRLMERMINYQSNNYGLTILKEEDRLDYKKDLEFVEHGIKLIKEDHVPSFSKVDMTKLNNVWKRYKPKPYFTHA